MAFVTWNDHLSVGIREIDNQHMKLVQMLNQFYDGLQNNQSSEATAKLLKSLMDYTVVHFATEEKYMDRFNFPGTAAHKQEHKKFIDKVTETKQQMDSGKFVLSLGVTKFVKEWIVQHITQTDKKYMECFHANGLK